MAHPDTNQMSKDWAHMQTYIQKCIGILAQTNKSEIHLVDTPPYVGPERRPHSLSYGGSP